MNVAMIPARMGSQRLARKNLREIGGVSLAAIAIRKCVRAGVFDEIWVNAEDDVFREIAEEEGVAFHKRPAELADNAATSEQYLFEFLKARECERVFQVHTIAPLLTAEQVAAFVKHAIDVDVDVLLSCTLERIECAMADRPINFTFGAKTNSQELTPIQRVAWSITGWRRETFMKAAAAGKTATYAGKVGFFPIDRLAGHIIKTEEDLRIAEALMRLRETAGAPS
jgi:CMP-N-acetylneuraminic acid synthetase